MRLPTTLILFLLVFSASAYAQTVADFHARYGKTVDVYSVSEHIWMTPEYAADGQVCSLRLYPKRIDAKTNYRSTKLPFNELRDVLNDLVPLDTRGTKKPGFGMTDTGGGTGWTHYDYENVLITFISFFQLNFDPKTLKRADFVLLDSDLEAAPEPVKNLTPDKDDFANSDGIPIEIVTVSWPGRKCPKQ